MEVLIPKYGHNMVIIDVDLSSFRMQNEPPMVGLRDTFSINWRSLHSKKESLNLLNRVTLKNQHTAWTVVFQFANCEELFVGCIPIALPFSPVKFQCLIWQNHYIPHDVVNRMPQTIPFINHLWVSLHYSNSRGANFSNLYWGLFIIEFTSLWSV